MRVYRRVYVGDFIRLKHSHFVQLFPNSFQCYSIYVRWVVSSECKCMSERESNQTHSVPTPCSIKNQPFLVKPLTDSCSISISSDSAKSTIWLFIYIHIFKHKQQNSNKICGLSSSIWKWCWRLTVKKCLSHMFWMWLLNSKCTLDAVTKMHFHKEKKFNQITYYS